MNGILLTVVGIAIRSVSLGFNSFITRTIGAEGMGLFSLIGTVYAFAVTFATSGISLTVTRLVASAIGEGRVGACRGILRSAVGYALAFSSVASLVLFFGAEYFGICILFDARTVGPLRILALSLIPISLSSVYSGYFVGVKRVAKNAVVQILGQIFKIGITTFFLLRYSSIGVEYGVIALAISMTLSEICLFLVALIQYIIDKRRHLPNPKTSEKHLGGILNMALPLALSAYVRSALLALEHALIPKRLRDGGSTQSEALSSYGILHGMALPILLYPIAPLSSFSGLLVPEFSEGVARKDGDRLSRIASEAINATLAYSIGAMTMLALFSEELGYVIYDSYEAGKYILLMAPVIPIMYLDHVSDSMLKGIGEHVYSMWVNISDSFLSIILVWFLIPRFNIGGYALVIVIMEGYNFLLSFLRLRSRISIRITPVSSVLLPFASGFIASSISKRLFTFSGSLTPPVWLFLEILFAVCAFLSIYLIMKYIGNVNKKRHPC